MGIAVAGPELEAESNQLLAPFIARVRHRRPYVTLKWAETADHRVGGPGGSRIQISSPPSMRQVHLMRSRSDAILVGRRTLVGDDPLLLARGVPQIRPLTRIVIMRRLDLSPSCQLLCTRDKGPIILCCSKESYERDGSSFLSLVGGEGVSLLPLPEGPDGELSLAHLLEALGRTTMTHLLVEPGPITAATFFRQNFADRVWVFRSPDRLNDETAPLAADVPFPAVAETLIGRDTLTEYLNPDSPVYSALEPSPDFVLASDLASDAPGSQ
jgi:diaminohydroxyphosphoribosylaminopyrimidine deaminase/5-amino-6-(5-phosphoribosylamino)uracil reductase